MALWQNLKAVMSLCTVAHKKSRGHGMAMHGRMLGKWRQRLTGDQDALDHVRGRQWLYVRFRGKGEDIEIVTAICTLFNAL